MMKKKGTCEWRDPKVRCKRDPKHDTPAVVKGVSVRLLLLLLFLLLLFLLLLFLLLFLLFLFLLFLFFLLLFFLFLFLFFSFFLFFLLFFLFFFLCISDFCKLGDIDATFERAIRDFPQYKVQVLSRDPWLITFDDLFTKEEADQLIKKGGRNFHRSVDAGT